MRRPAAAACGSPRGRRSRRPAIASSRTTRVGAANPEGTRRWRDLEQMSRPAGSSAPAQTMRNRLSFSLLETIKVPTLLIAGGADLYAPPPVMRLFADRIKDSEFVIVPDAGHSE